MAQLKDTIVSGNLRVTDTTLTDTLQVTTIKAPTSSNETTYGPGTSGQVLKSNGTSVYWTSDSTVSPATAVPQDVSTTAVIGTSTLYARQDHVHAIALATGDNNGQVKIANSNISVKGLASAAYVTQESLLRARSSVTTDGGATGWSQIGVNQYNGAYPDGVTNKIYNWGAVVSIPTGNARFDLYYNHNSSTDGATTNGLQYRTGWNNDKKAWRMLLDSGNYTSYTVKKDGTGATGSWGISITGNATSATKATQDGDGNTISSTYLKLSGGTMTGDIEYAGDGNRKIALGKNSFKYYVASNAGWAGGLSYYSNDGSTGLGYFGAYGQANTLEYHFIGGTYNAPQIKIEPTGPNLIINSEDASTPMITFFRKGSNKADWRIVNTGGNLKFQSDYTTTVGDWYDALTVEYNTGNITMKTNATFTFGKFASASANANRHVFFKEDGANRICVNDNFKYNPSTNILTVGSITGSAATWTTGRTFTIGSTDKSVDGSGNVSWTLSEIGAAASSHAHGNITSGGALQTTDITIASGDKLVVTDSSNSNKVARASISFDGSTTSKCLTQKGTWETFASSNTDTKVTQNIVATTTDKNYPLLLSYYESSSSTTTAQTANRAVGIYANAKTSKITLTSGTSNTSPGITATRTDTNASVSLLVGSGGTNHGVYSESMSKWLFVTNGTEAQTYNIAQNPSTATTYAISFGGTGFTTGLKGHYVNDGLGYRTREGIANTEGLSILVLGNSLASSVANNKTGYVRQYSTNEYYTDLKPNTLTASRTILLPDAAGTIAVFPAARTSGQVVVTDGTAGGVKSSGYTIAKSVPSDAKFTDENVTQSKTETTSYRPLVLGASYSTDPSTLAATITDQTYVSTTLYAQPKDGILYASRMYLKAPGSKGQLNLLTSKYNVMLRNDDSNTYFLVTAQNDPTGTWTSARPLTINNSTGVCSINGNAATSSSWATARTLTLGGQLTGSVSVKGNANMTLNGYLDRAFIYDDNAVPANHTWAEYAWHKFAEVTITDEFEDRVITFLVSRTHGSSAEHTGILSAKLRTKENKVYDSAQLKWLVRNSGLSKDDFVMVYTSTSGTSTKAELWCRIPDQYHGLVFTVLKEHRRNLSASSDWTLVDTPKGSSTRGSSSYPTTGITDKIISSDGIITNSTTGTANRATYLDVVSSNEIRFYNDNQFKASDRFWIGYSWAQGSHYTPSGGSDTSSTTAPNITKFLMGNCSQGGLASVHAKTFILGNGSSPTHTSKTTTIATAATTTDRTITLPDASGTIAIFPAARTSGQVVVTDGTAGAVKSSGYTIATSVPSGAKFTDANLTQTAVGSTYTNYRPIVISNANSDTEGFSPSTTTGASYITSSLYCQPSTGMLHANIFKAGKASTTDGEIKFYRSGSGNTGEITLKAAAQSTSGTYLLPARGNLQYTLSCGHEDLSAPTGSLSAANVLVPSYTKFIKIVFKSDSSNTLYSMVEIPYFGNGDYGALVQVGTFGDSQGAFRIIMKAVIIQITDGTQTGTKNFTITASPTTKINGSNVSDITRNITIHKIYAVD